MMDLWLGVDIGTTGCKAGIFDSAGKLEALAYSEYPLEIDSSGKAELNSELVLFEVHRVIKEVATGVGSHVRALAVSSQGEAITCLNANGDIISKAMVSSDSRPHQVCEGWERKFSREKLYRITGHTPHAIFSLFKILWLQKNKPELWESVDKVCCFEDLFHHSLGVEPAMSYPLAGRTALFDIHRHVWSEEILEFAGINISVLPRVLPSGSVVGIIPDTVAENLGLGSGVKVVAGGHDQTIAALGAGVNEAGLAMYATGTVECLCPAFSELHLSDELCQSNLNSYDFSIAGMSTCIGYSLTGGNILKWYRDNLGEIECLSAAEEGGDPYEKILAQLPEKPSSLMVLPYFTATGTPYFDVITPGAILGLRMSTSKEELLRGLLEGVAFEMRLNIELMRKSGMVFDKLILTGGGAKNQRWNQLKADVIGLPVVRSSYEEAGCYGASLLARVAVTGEDIKRIMSDCFAESYEPDVEKKAVYDRKFDDYNAMYCLLKGRSWS